MIKRVLGMPGDFVLAGTPSRDEHEEEDDDPENSKAREDMMIRVPDGHCWVIGDNLPGSNDSRLHGPIPLGLVNGKVVARLSPGMKWFGNGLQEPMEEGEDLD
jgi:mitochondrial inner membrane protease subunit 1